jgi:pilus assembly protein CpaE
MTEKILIVDDDIDTLHLVGMMLQRQGYQIVASNTGRQALALMQTERPDLVILDIMMPEMDGYEVARQIRANPAINGTPIIMFTAKAQTADKVSGYEAGADDYITKPTLPRELFAHVKAALERNRKVQKEQPSQPARQAHVVGILSARGGLGNSTLAMNLGLSLFKRTKQQVVIAELRPGEGTIGLELESPQLGGLTRLLAKRPAEITPDEVKNEIQEHPSGLRFLPASYNPQDAQLMQCVESIGQVARFLSQADGFLLLDLGPGIPASTAKILSLCNELIVVLESHPITILRTKALIDELVQKGIPAESIFPVVNNRSRSDGQPNMEQTQEQLGREIAVCFNASPELIAQAIQKSMPVVSLQPESSFSQQVNQLADLITPNIPATP